MARVYRGWWRTPRLRRVDEASVVAEKYRRFVNYRANLLRGADLDSMWETVKAPVNRQVPYRKLLSGKALGGTTWVAGILPLNYARIPISRQYKGLRHFVKSRSVPLDPV